MTREHGMEYTQREWELDEALTEMDEAYADDYEMEGDEE